MSRFELFFQRHFLLCAMAIVSLALGIRLIQYLEFIQNNPFSKAFFSDDWIYWVMAGGKAAGEWIDHSSPFLSAPLYPFLLGGLRWFGLDLTSVFFFQLCLGVISTGLLIFGARARYGETAALLAGLLYTLCEEPVLAFTKTMADESLLFLLIVLWFAWRRLIDHGLTYPRCLIGSVSLGLLCLMWPPAQLLIPIFLLQLFLLSRMNKENGLTVFLSYGLFALMCLSAIIAPVTWHNAKTDHSFILISANSGINLLQGNHPHSEGYITPINGIRTDRKNMFADAKAVFEQETGKSGNWKAIDNYFGDQAKEFILKQPLESTQLFAKKFYWFLSSYHYDNISIRHLEKAHGLHTLSWLSPIGLPLLMGLAVLGVASFFTEWRRFLPELTMLGLVIFVCVVFHYSARYRLPAAPLLCLSSAWVIVHWRTFSQSSRVFFLRSPLLRSAIAAFPLIFIMINAKTGFASVAFLEKDTATKVSHAYVEAGDLAFREGQLLQAYENYRHAIEADPEYVSPLLRALFVRDKILHDQNATSLTQIPVNIPAHLAQHPDVLRYQFNAAFAANKHTEAFRFLQNLMQQQPRDAALKQNTIWFVASCFTSPTESETQAALDVAREWLGQSRDQARIAAYVGLSLAEWRHRLPDRAQASLKTALRLAEREGQTEATAMIEDLQIQLRDQNTLDCKARPFSLSSPIDLSKPHPMTLTSLE